MTCLLPKPVSVTAFTWIPEQRMFVAEMSDIRGFGQVYDDACDEGLTLESRDPGRGHQVFVVDHTEIDADRDIRWWDLVPATPAARRAINFTLRVYND